MKSAKSLGIFYSHINYLVRQSYKAINILPSKQREKKNLFETKIFY